MPLCFPHSVLHLCADWMGYFLAPRIAAYSYLQLGIFLMDFSTLVKKSIYLVRF